MGNLIFKIFVGVVVSCYFFPFNTWAFPALNSKMVVAAFGLVLFCWEHFRTRNYCLRKDMIPVLLLGLLFSLSSYMSVAINGTGDMVYVTYFVSMAVWLGGAYCVIWLLRKLYGKASLQHVFIYLAIVSASQCIIALLIYEIKPFADFVNGIVMYAAEYYEHNRSRLYGIGAGFDSAGIRFSTVLLGIGYLVRSTSASRGWRIAYIIMFAITGTLGNMISRTTVVGVAFGLIYMLFPSVSWLRSRISMNSVWMWLTVSCGIVVFIMTGVYLYRSSPAVNDLMQYGFEGFINLFKTGTFSTHSSDLILDYLFVIHPDNIRTWLIGDGYFSDPFDPSKFYMGTDVGYTRFIFYGGLIGLMCFMSYFMCCTYVLSRRNRQLTMFFVMMFCLQLVVWIKIPTDIFSTFALMLLSDGHIAERRLYGNTDDTESDSLVLA